MRRLAVVIALSFALQASAFPGNAKSVRPAATLAAWFPFLGTGYRIPERPVQNDIVAGPTVAHWQVSGGTFADSTGNTWTQNGSPTLTSLGGFRNGFTSAAQQSFGGFTDAINFQLGTGSDVLDFTGDFFGCVVFSIPTLPASPQTIISDGKAGVAGWDLLLNANGTVTFDTYNGASTFSALTLTLGGKVAQIGAAMNVACFGRDGTNIRASINFSNVATTGATTIAADTTDPAFIGRGGAAGTAFSGTVSEVWFMTKGVSTQPPHTAVMREVFGTKDAFARPISFNQGPIPVEVYGSTLPVLYRIPGSAEWAGTLGFLMWNAQTNGALQSEALDNASWTKNGTAAVVADQATFVDGRVTMDKLTTTVATDSASQSITAYAGTSGPWVSSSYVTAVSGTTVGSVGITLSAGAPTGTVCSCVNSDGTICTCTTGTTATQCFAFTTLTLGANPVRLSVTCSSTLSGTPTMFLAPGQFSTSSGSANFGGQQFEIIGFTGEILPGPYAATTTAVGGLTVAQLAVGNALVNEPAFCFTGTWRPGDGRAWSQTDTMFFGGSAAGANTWKLQDGVVAGDNKIRWTINDATNTAKNVDATHAFAAGTAHSVTACADGLGGMTLAFDGIAQTVVASGAGTGVITSHQNVIQSSLGTFAFGGGVQNFKTCRTSNFALCQ